MTETTPTPESRLMDSLASLVEGIETGVKAGGQALIEHAPTVAQQYVAYTKTVFSTDIYAGCHVVRCAKDAGIRILNRTPGNPQGKSAPAVIVKRVEQLETMVAVLEKEVAELKG